MEFSTVSYDDQSFEPEDQKIFPREIFEDHLGSEHSLILSPSSTDQKESISSPPSSVFSPQSTTCWDDFSITPNFPLLERLESTPFHPAMAQNWSNAHLNFENIQSNNLMARSSSNATTSHDMMTSAMNLAEQQDIELRSIRMGTATPHRMLAELRRDGGVRKKNARFEIPNERNLKNIDSLITEAALADNEDLLKELKQQKRLLRNRQAALDSRQRKKKHTESLEQEQKLWFEDRRNLADQVSSTNMQNQEFLHIIQNLRHEIEVLKNEKEDLISKHTLTEIELRKKINVLKEQLQRPQPDFTTDISHHSMNSEPWASDVGWMAEFAEQKEQEENAQETGMQQPETTLVVGRSRKNTIIGSSQDLSNSQIVSHSFLLLFLLYGAFVATKATGSSDVPAMAPEYRAQAAAILNNVLLDENKAQNPTIALQHANALHAVQSWVHPNGVNPSSPAFSPAAMADANSFESLTHKVLTPTKEQEAEAAFSMTPAQYNALTNPTFARPLPNEDGNGKPAHPTLTEQLEAYRKTRGDQESVAEVYTRSLMWDRIPPEVVSEFKKMVAMDDPAMSE